MKFLHLSDLHYLVDYGDLLERMSLNYHPTDLLVDILSNFAFSSVDFVVITGDLVNEGTTADYRSLDELLRQFIPPNMPIYKIIGNHDHKPSFYEANNMPINHEPYYYAKEIEGYNLIFLDTSIYLGPGVLEGEQYEWLKNQLNKDLKHIIFQHHPLEFTFTPNDNPESKLQLPDDYYEVIPFKNITAIFNRHLHMEKKEIIKGIPQFVGDSLFYGIRIYGDETLKTNRRGYSVVTIEDDILIIDEFLAFPSEHLIGKFM